MKKNWFWTHRGRHDFSKSPVVQIVPKDLPSFTYIMEIHLVYGIYSAKGCDNILKYIFTTCKKQIAKYFVDIWNPNQSALFWSII